MTVAALLASYKKGRRDFRWAQLAGVDLRGQDLRGVVWSDADLQGCDLRNCNLSGANLARADLRGADLSGANLQGAILNRAKLAGAQMSGADLSAARLINTDLTQVDLGGVNLTNADLTGAQSPLLAPVEPENPPELPPPPILSPHRDVKPAVAMLVLLELGYGAYGIILAQVHASWELWGLAALGATLGIGSDSRIWFVPFVGVGAVFLALQSQFSQLFFFLLCGGAIFLVWVILTLVLTVGLTFKTALKDSLWLLTATASIFLALHFMLPANPTYSRLGPLLLFAVVMTGLGAPSGLPLEFLKFTPWQQRLTCFWVALLGLGLGAGLQRLWL